MAIKLKVGKTITDKHGTEHSDAYSVIDYVAIDKKSLYCKFNVRVFANKISRDNNFNPIDVISHCCSGDEFELFFGVSKIKNLHALCYDYAAQLTKTIQSVEVDGKDTEELVYLDWESDEQ